MERSQFCPTCQNRITLQESSTDRNRCPACRTSLDSFDVFISHSTHDRLIADEFAASLRAVGISCWLAHERVGWGEWFVEQINNAIETAKAVLLVASPAAEASPWVVRELGYAVEKGRPILPYKTNNEYELGRNFRFLIFNHQFVTSRSFVGGIEEAIEKIQELLVPRVPVRPAIPTPPAPKPALLGVDWSVEPYVGPGPFRPQTNQKFCGRKDETRELLEKLAQYPLVLLYASSGAGKSSLLNRSIRDSLEAQEWEVLTGARVGGPLSTNLSVAEVRNIYTYAAIYNLENRDAFDALPANINLTDYLKQRRRRTGARGRVLIFDQFEEIFTRHKQRFRDRDEFFDDLLKALQSDENLRVILAIRKEYLAEILPIVDKASGAVRMELTPLTTQGALEAITEPISEYASFAPGVAKRIVDELMMIRVKDSDGVEVNQRGEFVDMVELQIVCSFLWKKISERSVLIDNELVDKAIGKGRTLSEFAINALDEFYKETIHKVANEKYSEELIRLACMRFVTPSGTRRLVQRNSAGRTGLLPDSIVQQLENLHLLRSEEHGTDRWYELAHDRLTEPVSRRQDRKLSALLNAEEVLGHLVEKAWVENGGNLDGYFKKHRDILSDCAVFLDKPGLLSENQAEFLYRASIVEGSRQVMMAWSERLAADYLHLVEKVLRDALDTSRSVLNSTGQRVRKLFSLVRRNTATLLGIEFEPFASLSPRLTQLALADADMSVRRAAAVSLVRLDKPELYDQVVSNLPAEEALGALANMRVATDQKLAAEEKASESPKAPGPRFESCFLNLYWWMQARILMRARRNRFEEGLSWSLIIAVAAAILAAASAGLFKWIPGGFAWSLEQKAGAVGMGVFHGLSGGVIWGGSIALGLTLFYVVIERQQDRKSTWRPVGAIIAGGLFGLISSLIITLVVVSVFETNSLVGMGWITNPKQAKFGVESGQELFASIRYGWVQPIIGTGMGIGMALAANRLRAWEHWIKFLRRQRRVTGWRQSVRIFRGILPIAAKQIWPVPLMIIVSAVIAFFVPNKDISPVYAISQNIEKLKARPGDRETKSDLDVQLNALSGDVSKSRITPPPPVDAISTIAIAKETLDSNPEAHIAIANELRRLEAYYQEHDVPTFWSRDFKFPNNSPRARRIQLIHGLIADCTSQMLGAYFAIVGMGFGMVIVTHGVSLDPWKT